MRSRLEGGRQAACSKPASPQDACAVVTDEFSCFFLPRMQRAAATRLGEARNVCLEARRLGRAPVPAARHRSGSFPSAHTFRRQLQKDLRAAPRRVSREARSAAANVGAARARDRAARRRCSTAGPSRERRAARGAIPGALAATSPRPRRWRPHRRSFAGGFQAGRSTVSQRFLENGAWRAIRRGPQSPRRPRPPAGLSPYLHFGARLDPRGLRVRWPGCAEWSPGSDLATA